MFGTLKVLPRAALIAAFAVAGSMTLGACEIEEGQQEAPGQPPAQQPPAQQQ